MELGCLTPETIVMHACSCFLASAGMVQGRTSLKSMAERMSSWGSPGTSTFNVPTDTDGNASDEMSGTHGKACCAGHQPGVAELVVLLPCKGAWNVTAHQDQHQSPQLKQQTWPHNFEKVPVFGVSPGFGTPTRGNFRRNHVLLALNRFLHILLHSMHVLA
jgi:hypothetical protein